MVSIFKSSGMNDIKHISDITTIFKWYILSAVPHC